MPKDRKTSLQTNEVMDDIDALAAAMERHRLVELEVERAGVRIRLRASAGPTEASGGARATCVETAVIDERVRVVTAPVVGTFYRAPAPEAPPFVEVGTRVRKGQVLCIIEAMKLMNEIDADADGVVDQIFVESGQAVQYGDTLFTIRASP